MSTSKHTTPAPVSRLLTVVFTDVVGSTGMKTELGDRVAATLLHEHHALVRETLTEFEDGEEIETAGDSFLLIFGRPSEAVRFCLVLRERQRACRKALPVVDRFSVHLGEIITTDRVGSVKPDGTPMKALTGVVVDECARVLGLADGDQILVTRPVFDGARQQLLAETVVEDGGDLQWVAHGPYRFKGSDTPVEVCEVALHTDGDRTAPGDSEKAWRHDPAEEVVLGWRPAVGLVVPRTRFRLLSKLGEGAVGEVWLAQHDTLKEKKVFKFCFQAERVRSLRRELTLFKVLRERVGQHRHIAAIQEVALEEPPFYLVVEYVDGVDLAGWLTEDRPLDVRIEIVSQVALALQAAHEAGVVHRDVKPANILVGTDGDEIRARLSDFGIGQVLSETALDGITRLGFTETLMASGGSSNSGTRLYLAPELLDGEAASPRSDLYALGVVLYQLIVGNPRKALPPDWEVDIPDPLLREDLSRCFAGDPEKRFVSTAQLARHLRALPDRQAERDHEEATVRAREQAAYRRGMGMAVAGAMVVITLVTGLAVVAWRDRASAMAAIEEAHEQLVGHYFAAGTARLDARDPLGALPWFVRILQAVEGDPVAEENARARIASVLDGTPQLTDQWDWGTSTSAVAISDDAQWVAVAGVDLRVYRRGEAEPRAVQEAVGATWWKSGLALSKDGGTLASISADEVGVHRMPDLAAVGAQPRPHSTMRHDLTLSDDGVWAFSSNGCDTPPLAIEMASSLRAEPPQPPDGATLCLWDPSSGLQVVSRKADGGRLLTVVTPDGRTGSPIRIDGDSPRFARAAGTGRLAITNGQLVHLVDADGEVRQPPFPTGSTIRSVLLDRDGEVLVTGSTDGVQIWNPDTGKLRAPTLEARGGVVKVDMDASGRHLVTLDRLGIARVWRLRHDLAQDLDLAAVQRLPGGLHVLGRHASGLLQVRDARTGALVTEFEGRRAQVSADGRYVAARVTPEQSQLVDLQDPERPAWPIRAQGTSHGVTFAPTGHRFAYQADDGVRIGSPDHPEELGPWDLPTYSTQWSPDGSELLVVHGTFPPTPDFTGPRWTRFDTATGAEMATVDGYEAVWLSDDAVLASSLHHDRPLERLALDGTLLGPSIGAGGTHGAAGVSVGPNGRQAALVRGDGSFRIWDLDAARAVTGAIRPAHAVGPGNFTHAEPVFLAGGRHIATGLSAGRTEVWDTRTGELVAAFPLQTWGAWERTGRFVEIPSLRVDDRPVADLVGMSDLLSGLHVTPSGADALTREALMERWAELSPQYPDDLGGTAIDAQAAASARDGP